MPHTLAAWGGSVFLLALSLAQHQTQAPEFSLSVAPERCPGLEGRVWHSAAPAAAAVLDNTRISFRQAAGAGPGLSGCVDACCTDTTCNVAFLYYGENTNSSGCFLVSCKDDSACLPVARADPAGGNSSLVLVRPVEGATWSQPSPAGPPASRVCEVGLEQCRQHEVCRPANEKSRSGVCDCVAGADPGGGCLPPAASTLPVPTPASLPIKLFVSVESQVVQLPTSSANLSALVSPPPGPDSRYKYEWQLVSMPGTEADQTAVEKNSKSQTLILTNLVVGVYQFKVKVTSQQPAGYGETAANVTVLPVPRVNRPPVATIVPAVQTVTLPTNTAIIDGSGTTDDSGPVALYTWELTSFPVGYQPQPLQGSIVTLVNLTAGNYTVKLTVTDEDGAADSAIAAIQVLKETDYKPKANAGEDVIVYLPQNTVLLNGNKSYDDKGVVTWEWTKEKGGEGVELPADIAGARSPFLTVSNMVEGKYDFLLKVTDEAGQSDEDGVSIFVKPATNLPPVADAGKDQSYNLPLPTVTLDGSLSRDDGNITAWQWSAVRLPAGARPPLLSSPTAARTNVSGLTVGQYTFQLVVTDNTGNNNSDQVRVTVKQDTNKAPVANPGPDLTVSLPTNEVTLDGSRSSDDLGIVAWLWHRDPDSLAAGKIVGNMSSPRLTITGLVPGSYSFTLQVFDGQGKNGSKSVKIRVVQDPNILNIVEIVLNRNLSHFTQRQRTVVLERVRVLSKGKGELSVEDVRLEEGAARGLASLSFKVFSSTAGRRTALAGPVVVAQLRRELTADPELLGVPVLSLQTRVCQNNCGGHGECDQQTRDCVCQPAWMENWVSRRLLGGEANCDWSVVYVVLVAGLSGAVVVVWCCLARCRSRPAAHKARSTSKYSRLNTSEETMEMNEGGNLMNTESESEEEILFESAKKARRLNGSVPRPANGYKDGLKKISKLKT